MSINSVSISGRFETSSKTKRAACSLARPWRDVPRMTGRKTGPMNDSMTVLSPNSGKTYNDQ